MLGCWSFTWCLSRTLDSHWNAASLSLFYRYYCGRCSSELAQLVPLPHSRSRPTRYSDSLHSFSVTIHRCYKDIYVNSFFHRTARLRNSLLAKYFPLNYYLNRYKSRVNRYLFSLDSFFLISCPVYFLSFPLIFLLTPFHVVAV